MRFLKEYESLVSVQLGVAIAGVYLASTFLGTKLMEDRQAIEAKPLKAAYNVVQVVICSIVLFGLLPFFLSPVELYGLNIKLNPTVEWWVLVYYACKLLDLFDTFFIVLGKKTRQLSVLHLWHHSSIVPLFAWILSQGHGAGSLSWLPLLNSIVHILMYSHYFITSIFTFKNMWWKPIITGCQMGHHALLIVLMSIGAFVNDQDFSMEVAFWGSLWGCSILGLFVKFYFDSYKQSTTKKVGKRE